ncbi:hypothetical protein [Acinetobacter defluvii]|uniref:hypothetical protein n=1 Tax=Acinetobacter defluvii TaxID=1871111 RepID=UPI003AF49403
MNNAWLGAGIGMLLGGAAVGGYMWYDGQSSSKLTTQQPKTTQQSPVSERSSFLSQDLLNARLNALNFKEIMRLFYKETMRNVYVTEGQLDNENFIGVGVPDAQGESTVAFMHPVINYRNVDGEARFLIVIEKIQVMDSGIVVSCHACVGSADLYSFKKLANGQYQIVSKTRPEQEYAGSYGHVQLDREEILNNLQPIGKKLIGSFYRTSYSNMGETTSSWNVIHLPEDDFIGIYDVAEAAGDNAGSHEEDSPLYFSFDSTIQVIDNGKSYFPIQVNYSGEKYTADYSSIEANNQQLLVSFDAKKKEYLSMQSHQEK